MALQNRIHCLYVMGLGHLGLGRKENAAREFAQVTALDPNHQNARIFAAYCVDAQSAERKES
ncbi:MAG: hypothetical protein IJT34_00755 [Butyrivibrio sp.]|nr:hypothetical protein [Butyrivibrio sp.]